MRSPHLPYRLLLAALLLLVPGLRPVAMGAQQEAYIRGWMVHAAVHRVVSPIRDEERTPPKDIVLSAGHTPVASCIHSGDAGGPCGYASGFPAPVLQRFSKHTDIPGELRRWRLLSSRILLARLRALYPEHGFW